MSKNKNEPYIEEHKIKTIRRYNPEYGDNRICICGHPYHRHFDSYENMRPVGCKYCGCHKFVEAGLNGKENKEKIDKLEKFTRMFEQTFDWGCNDRAKFLYANAIYSVISGSETFKECEQEFIDYMHENKIS